MFNDIVGHEGPKAILQAAMKHDRIAHAYLFHGEERIGKRFTAMRFAQALNCEEGQDPERPDACGLCRSCQQIEAHTHPDFVLIEPDRELANPQIKIEEIRGLEQQIIYRPLIGRFKIVLIDEADRLTIGAANALLKTLEEPPAHSIFVLTTSRPYALPSTIQSRCQNLRFVPAAQTQVEAALIVKRNIPPGDARLVAIASQSRVGLALHTDIKSLRATQDEFHTLLASASLRSITAVLSAAESLAKSDRATEALEWIAQWLRDLLLVTIGAQCEFMLNTERMTELKEIARAVRLDALLDLLAEVERIHRASTRNINLQLALETLLLQLRDAVHPSATPPVTR
jgi:DNA polymerase III subunit delta'